MYFHHPRQIRVGLRAALAFWSVVAFARGDDAPKNLAEMKAKYIADTQAYHAKLEKATEADRAAMMAANWQRVKATARQAFEYAKAHPDAPDSSDAIAWTVHGMVNGYYPEYADQIAEAYRDLLERGLDSDSVAKMVYYTDTVANECPEARRFLEAARERSKSRLIRGAAALALARTDRDMAHFARLVRDPIAGSSFVDYLSKNDPKYLEKLRSTYDDADAADRRAEAMFESVIAEFTDVRLPQPYRQESFAELAKGELYALRHLAIGRTAPEIVGEDVRGGPIRLSDHRGKVVAVVFWATWCGPCMAEVPNERKLVAKMAGRPFTLIGVDGDRDAAKKAMAEQNMNWPSVWNGGQGGGIVEAWGVRAWPTVYVLDAQGVIHFQDLRGEQLDRGVEHLVAEAEAKQRANGKP